jgi:hypothetical protein
VHRSGAGQREIRTAPADAWKSGANSPAEYPNDERRLTGMDRAENDRDGNIMYTVLLLVT